MPRTLIAVAAMVYLAGLPMDTVSAADPWKAEIRPLVERLHVNYLSLDAVYHQLHEAAIDAVDRSAEELGYIQKTYLFVSEANLICFYQWELLAIVDYIEDDKVADYLTLRVRDLDRSIFESRDRINSLQLYSGFIDHAGARQSIEQAVGLIEANIYTYEALRDVLQPLANPPNRYNRKL